MSRLIDADALPKYTGYALSADEVAKAVENAPTIDAVKVKHGEWIWEDSVCSPRTCSICKQKFYIGRGWKFCPNCGAKMDGAER